MATITLLKQKGGCGAHVFPGISQRVAVAESVLCGLTIREYEGDSDSAKEFAALADAVGGVL
jgi:cellulose biosynthesis protein BcsQ